MGYGGIRKRKGCPGATWSGAVCMVKAYETGEKVSTSFVGGIFLQLADLVEHVQPVCADRLVLFWYGMNELLLPVIMELRGD